MSKLTVGMVLTTDAAWPSNQYNLSGTTTTRLHDLRLRCRCTSLGTQNLTRVTARSQYFALFRSRPRDGGLSGGFLRFQLLRSPRDWPRNGLVRHRLFMDLRRLCPSLALEQKAHETLAFGPASRTRRRQP
ncbi:hypothetical protein EDD17DRAFT_1737623 [Pisolithus thermaeus]|nr:hypothetical protein EDD17DRAFT_1737623 [Pisolithus thermaeus]